MSHLCGVDMWNDVGIDNNVVIYNHGDSRVYIHRGRSDPDFK